MHKELVLIFLLLNSVTIIAQRMPECWYRSKAAFANGENVKALAWVDSCLLQNKNSFQYLQLRGEVLYSQHQFIQAIEAFKEADRLKKNSASYFLAKSYSAFGDTSNSFKWLRVNLSSEFREKESIIKLDPVFTQFADTKAWNLIWKKEWYSSYEKLLAEIEYQISLKKWEDALDLLDQKITDNSKHQLFALRAQVYKEMGSYNLAIDDYSKAIKKNKRNSEYLFQRSKVYITQNRLSNAKKDIESAINYAGENPLYIKERATIFFLNKMNQNAFDDINKYLSFYPSDISAIKQKIIIAIELNLFVDALFEINKLIKVESDNPEYYYLRGLCYYKTQNYKFAEDDFSISIKNSFKLDECYFYRGLAKFYQSKLADACSDWDSASKNGYFKSQELLYKHCNRGSQIKKK